MNPLWKLYAADEGRKSRLHDLQGNLVSLGDMLVLPQRLVEKALTKIGHYSSQPWWPPEVARRLESILDANSTVVEFGSGMSTAWIARRARSVTAVEHNPQWRMKVVQQLAQAGLSKNAQVLLRTLDNYLDLELAEKPRLVVVDGELREECVNWAMRNVAEGGFIYLDNSDRDSGEDSGASRARMIALANTGAIEIEAIRGYPPGILAPTEGMLARVVRPAI